MNDADLINAVRGAFAGFELTASADSVARRGRVIHRRRRARGFGAAAAMAALGTGLAVSLLAHGVSPALASFTVTERPGGVVAVTIRDLNHPDALLRELRRDGVRASFSGLPLFTARETINRSCLRTMTPMTRRALTIRASADPRQAAFLLHPAAIPPRDTLDIYWADYSPGGYAHARIRASVGVPGHRYVIPLTTAGPFAFQADLVTPGRRCV